MGLFHEQFLFLFSFCFCFILSFSVKLIYQGLLSLAHIGVFLWFYFCADTAVSEENSPVHHGNHTPYVPVPGTEPRLHWSQARV